LRVREAWSGRKQPISSKKRNPRNRPFLARTAIN